MESLTEAQRRAALSESLDCIEDVTGLLPAPEPFPFDPVPGIERAVWNLGLVEQMVEGELQEVTNQLNRWLGNLRRWHAWLQIRRYLGLLGSS